MAQRGTKILLIDDGGRGHAIADLFCRTDDSVTVYYGPGCPAIKEERIISVPDISMTKPETAVLACESYGIDFVFMSSIQAQDAGFVDCLRRSGIRTIGPDRMASRLESSKSFTKKILKKYRIRTAASKVFDQPGPALKYIQESPTDVVVKADGLCNGAGAFVCNDKESARDVVDKLMRQRVHGVAGERVLIEERLRGIEVSLFALFDGEDFLLFPTALDYKRSDERNVGINTEGMGSFSPHPLESSSLYRQAALEIFAPLRSAIISEGLNYTGFLYVGAMLCEDGLKVIEINARFGDSEAQVVLPRIRSNFSQLCEKVFERRLGQAGLDVANEHYCDVVAAQGATRRKDADGRERALPGWPYGQFDTGFPIQGLEAVRREDCRLFLSHCGLDAAGRLVTTGGRVLHVVGKGNSHQQAVYNAYANIGKIRFEGLHYRRDIGAVYDPLPAGEAFAEYDPETFFSEAKASALA